ncbi:MAG TPA: TetR/AcrR family transcriptional regulator [Sphingomonas sp.]|jgi:AcrR family transcriptional regulator
MGRRSDHSRAELEALMLQAGQHLLAEVGLARFSAREVAKRVGYSVGTIHNVFGGYDPLVTAINTQTFARWTQALRARLAGEDGDRIAALIEGYFAFAREHTALWTAIFDHRLPPGAELTPADHEVRGQLTEIVVREVAGALGRPASPAIESLARSLIATVHGHCAFALTGSFALMGETAPEAMALARVRESLAAAA